MNMPLVLAKIDETYKIIRLHGNDSLHNRLEELGFVVGAEVKGYLIIMGILLWK